MYNIVTVLCYALGIFVSFLFVVYSVGLSGIL